MGFENNNEFGLREKQPRFNSVTFSEDHFGQTKTAVGTDEVVVELNEWWARICLENKINNPDDRRLKNIDYYIFELGKNALEHAGGGEIKVLFGIGKITVIVTDQGPGFENPNDDIEALPEHGLSEVKKFSDEFMIETNGRRFTKIPGKRKLVVTEDTRVVHGTRITLVKKVIL
jgi:anti-sigma regulatory factor (Ser/Thr protein kinase)